MTTAWMYASSTDGERWILQGLRTWGLSITRALRRAGDEPPRIGTLLDRAHSRSGVFCQAAEALWLRSLGSHDTRPILSALRRLAEAVVALTGPKAKITGAIWEIDIDLGDVPADERESLDEVLFLWRRLTMEDTKPLSLRQPPALGPHRRSAHPPLDPREPLSWLRALRVGDGARMHVEFSDAPATPSSPKPPPDEIPTIGPRLTTSQAVVFTSLTRLQGFLVLVHNLLRMSARAEAGLAASRSFLAGSQSSGPSAESSRRLAPRSRARLAKALGLRRRVRSSPREASRRQWLRFSTPAQCERLKSIQLSGPRSCGSWLER